MRSLLRNNIGMVARLHSNGLMLSAFAVRNYSSSSIKAAIKVIENWPSFSMKDGEDLGKINDAKLKRFTKINQDILRVLEEIGNVNIINMIGRSTRSLYLLEDDSLRYSFWKICMANNFNMDIFESMLKTMEEYGFRKDGIAQVNKAFDELYKAAEKAGIKKLPKDSLAKLALSSTAVSTSNSAGEILEIDMSAVAAVVSVLSNSQVGVAAHSK